MCVQALMAAVLGGKSDSVRELLARGADPEVPNRDGMTPLQAAAFQNQRDVIEALIEGGAAVEVRDMICSGHQADAAFRSCTSAQASSTQQR